MSFITPKGTELKTITLKGKIYLPVAERILWFREEKPNWTIRTTMIFSDESYSQAKAEILDETGRLIASGHKSETAKGFPDHLEKAETGAIGRALALCGYGTQFAQELDESDTIAPTPPRIVDAPREAVAALKVFNENSPPVHPKLKERGITEIPPIPGNTNELAHYKVKFGKHEGRELKSFTVSEGDSYCKWLIDSAAKDGKPLSIKGVELVNNWKNFRNAVSFAQQSLLK